MTPSATQAPEAGEVQMTSGGVVSYGTVENWTEAAAAPGLIIKEKIQV